MGYSIIRKAIGPDSDVGVYYEKAGGNYNVILDFKNNIAKIPDNVPDQENFVSYLQQNYSQFFSVAEWKEMINDLGNVPVSPMIPVGIIEDEVFLRETSDDEMVFDDEDDEDDEEEFKEIAENPTIEPEEDIEDITDEDPVAEAVIKAKTMDEVAGLLLQAGCLPIEDHLVSKLQQLRDSGLVSVLVGKQNGIITLAVKRVLKKHKG